MPPSESTENSYRHIPFQREPDWEPPRRTRPYPPPQPPTPEDRHRHGRDIEEQSVNATQQTEDTREDLGVDPSHLRVLQFSSINLTTEKLHDVISRFGASIVDERAQEISDDQLDDRSYRLSYMVQFPSSEALDRFQEEIAHYQENAEESYSLPQGMRRRFFDGLQAITVVSSEERKGNRLRNEGFPDADQFYLDVDLWYPKTEEEADHLYQEARSLCQEFGGRVTDRVRTPSMLLLKVQANRELAERLLTWDAIATVNLPPKLSTSPHTIFDEIDFPETVETVADDAPVACVIDSGVIAGHPALQGSVVDEQSYCSREETPADLHGHGTEVAGILVYGDVNRCLEEGEWNQQVKICSAKVLVNSDPGDAKYVEERRLEGVLQDAIEYFHDEWGCRIFNICIGDEDDLYDGGRQFQLAEKLDQLAVERDIVIVVPTVNRSNPPVPSASTNGFPREQFYDSLKTQLLSDEQRLCSPGTSAVALTVGAITRTGATGNGRRSLRDAIPGAPHNAPAPFTRTGPGYSLHGRQPAVKPDLVHYGGNYGLHTPAGADPRWARSHMALGELSTIKEVNGRFVGPVVGTSYAAPRVAHCAALGLKSLEEVFQHTPSANLVRALVGSTAVVPNCEKDWFENEEERLRLIGYGRCSEDVISHSTENRVCLVGEDKIAEDKLHVYEIQVPDVFLETKGRRGITVALAYDPPVRSSRMEYLSRTMWFELLHGLTPAEVRRYRAKYEEGGDSPRIPSKNQRLLRPPKTKVEWSTLQVRGDSWTRKFRVRANENGDQPVLHLMIGCQKRFSVPLSPPQSYGVVVKFWHESDDMELYHRIRDHVRIRERPRIRVRG